MSDETEQSDEMLALQSICGDEAFVCEISKKPYSGTIYIDCQADSNIHDVICNGMFHFLSEFAILCNLSG